MKYLRCHQETKFQLILKSKIQRKLYRENQSRIPIILTFRCSNHQQQSLHFVSKLLDDHCERRAGLQLFSIGLLYIWQWDHYLDQASLDHHLNMTHQWWKLNLWNSQAHSLKFCGSKDFSCIKIPRASCLHTSCNKDKTFELSIYYCQYWKFQRLVLRRRYSLRRIFDYQDYQW